MSEIRITAGTWDAEPAAYAEGLLRLPNGNILGVEDLSDLSVTDNPETGPQRRVAVVRGLRSALSAVGPLPRPLNLAASFVGLGLGVIGGDVQAGVSLQARFPDGTRVVIVADPATAAQMMRDREVIRLAALRRTAIPPAPVVLALPAPEPEQAAERALTSIFEYEKRKGRLRRLAIAKAPGESEC
ncbi:hypothetical protein G3T14_11785 [Methylobacterium sp. BTF04]|uniref:hypothetical protein n=1 Tax=Methylobacterium sp. BTF04 TaxID=2708300 RepID=UPI0013D808AC|nr:hypothetical protein [Methylobacterium sp. BTF04]NEU12812.1 hypothetical protein [Methylobacterium sp. BTF04]